MTTNELRIARFVKLAEEEFDGELKCSKISVFISESDEYGVTFGIDYVDYTDDKRGVDHVWHLNKKEMDSCSDQKLKAVLRMHYERLMP